MTAIIVNQKIGFVGGVTRGVPPHNCAIGCPEHQSRDVCQTCRRRPIKQIDAEFGGFAVEDAIRTGLVTAEQVEQFRNEITGGM